MRRFLVIAGAIVVALIVLAFVGLEAVARGAGKDRIATALSNALGVPVRIGELSVSLLPTPSLSAGRITVGGVDSTAAPSVSVRSLRVVPDLMSFLPGRTKTITRVDLIGLAVAARRDRSGHWLVPVPPTAAGTGSATKGPATSGGGVDLNALHVRDGGVRVVDDSLQLVTRITAVEADLEEAGGALTVPRFTGRLGSTVVTGSAGSGASGITLHLSSASINNADLPSLFALAGMRPYPGLTIGGAAPFDMSTRIGPDLQSFSVTGTAAMQRVQLGAIALQSLQAPFRFDTKVFTLDPMTFTLYHGHQHGHVAIDMTGSTPSYRIRTAIAGLDVDQALRATTTMKHVLLGTARLSADVRGSGTTEPAIERSLAGTTAFGVVNGTITNFPIIAAINQALGITGGSMQETTFDSLTGTATIANGRARTNDLTLRAGELTMAAQGTYGFDQSVNFKAVVRFSAAKANQLAQLTPLAKHLQNAKGEIEIPVTVTGTASAPTFGVDVATLAKKGLTDQVKQGLFKLLPH